MSRFVNWYLVELDGLLRERVSADRLHALMSEVELHLSESLEERKSKGMTGEEAELAVIEAMGSPEWLAQKELGGNKWTGIGAKLAVGSALCIGALWFVLGFTPESVFHPNVGAVLVIGLPLFWLGCFLSRNLAWRPLVLAGALGAMSVAIHQGTRHIYIGEQEFLVEAAAAAVRHYPETPPADARHSLAYWDSAQQAAATTELAKSPLVRTVQRLPQAVVGISVGVGFFALVGFALASWPRRRMISWLRRRLA